MSPSLRNILGLICFLSLASCGSDNGSSDSGGNNNPKINPVEVDSCRLLKPVKLDIKSLPQLWPEGSNISRTLILNYLSSNGFVDTIELRVANELKYTGQSDDSLRSPGKPSKFITGLFGSDVRSKEKAFLSYPDGVLGSNVSPVKYELKKASRNDLNSATYLNERAYLPGHPFYGQPDTMEGLSVIFKGNMLLGIKLFYVERNTRTGESINRNFCVEEAEFKEMVELEYAI